MLQASLHTEANRGPKSTYRIDIRGGTFAQQNDAAMVVLRAAQQLTPRLPPRVVPDEHASDPHHSLFEIRPSHALTLLQIAENTCCELRKSAIAAGRR